MALAGSDMPAKPATLPTRLGRWLQLLETRTHPRMPFSKSKKQRRKKGRWSIHAGEQKVCGSPRKPPGDWAYGWIRYSPWRKTNTDASTGLGRLKPGSGGWCRNMGSIQRPQETYCSGPYADPGYPQMAWDQSKAWPCRAIDGIRVWPGYN